MKNTIIVTLLVLVIILCIGNVNAKPIDAAEASRIESLLSKVSIPETIRKDFSTRLLVSPDLDVSDGEQTVTWYLTKDSTEVGIILIPAGQGMKQWNSASFNGFIWYNRYQLVSMNEARQLAYVLLVITRDSLFSVFSL